MLTIFLTFPPHIEQKVEKDCLEKNEAVPILFAQKKSMPLEAPLGW
jgi:hypothetical protein